MFRIKKISIILSLFFLGLAIILPFVSAEGKQQTYPDICAVYITGVGCSNCAVTDPVILYNLPSRNNNFVVIEYEIYKLREANQETSTKYFENYLPEERAGVPFVVLNKELKALGRSQVSNIGKALKEKQKNPCPLPSGESINFRDLDLSSLPGKVKIWHKGRVLIKEDIDAKSQGLKEIFIADNINLALRGVQSQPTKPKKISISKGEIFFENAIRIDGWLLQWGKKKVKRMKSSFKRPQKLSEVKLPPILQGLFNKEINSLKEEIRVRNIAIAIESFLILVLILLLAKNRISFLTLKKNKKLKSFILILTFLTIIALAFVFAKNISPDFFKNLSGKISFPAFTFFIALIDGFNPCNLFVLTLLLALLVSASGSRKRIYIVGFIFVTVVFLFYFFFMVAWLNIFKYLSFFTPVRITVAIIAVLAGLINCKDFFFFKKGVSLTIDDKQRGFLVKKMNKVRKITESGSLCMLVLSSVGLAVFSSCIELPCTAGFPIIFTTILVAKTASSSINYYLWIFFYNIIYVLPLALIVAVLGYTFRAKRISQRQIQVIKLIGGIIMIALGLIILVNPQLVGITLR